MSSLSLLQYKEIVKVVNDTYGLDIHNFSLNSMRMNMGRMMDKFHLRSPDSYIKGLKTNRLYFDFLEANLHNEHVYLFRDPSFWRMLPGVLETILKKEDLKIWVPEAGKGEELFTLLITLHEHDLLSKAHIIVSDISRKNLDLMRAGKFDLSKKAEGQSNYKRYNPAGNLERYISSSAMGLSLDRTFLKGIIFKHGWVEQAKLPYKVNFILFRNRLIFYNHVLEVNVLKALAAQLKGGGLLALGVKENPGIFDLEHLFKLFDNQENIYKRAF
jgi:chemotaxis methyl-accepting protein methylase